MVKREFCVGDHLRIRSYNDLAKEYGCNIFGDISIKNDSCWFTRGMRKLCGQKFTVKCVRFNQTYVSYEGIEGRYTITASMLEYDCDYSNDDIDDVNDKQFIQILEGS